MKLKQERMKNIKIKEILNTNKEYPEKLKEIYKPPSKLYALGNTELLQNPSIAIVGSRDSTEYGKKYAYQFASSIACSNITVVSGLAIGIDTYAHKGSIEEVGKTIAVIGSGFNHIYPKENKELFKQIIQKGGLVISEYPPNTEPNLKTFPFRNRIIAGLSIAVLVVEAKFRSGSGITARYALKQGKKVFCLPHTLEDKNGVGTNNLLKAGAKLITSPEEISQYLNIQITEPNNINTKTTEKPKSNILEVEKLEKDYQAIYKILLKGPISVNQLAQKLNLKVSTLNGYLTIMEIKGYITSLPGNEVKIKEK